MFKGFRSFLLRGNVVDLAVGIVIGAAFTAVVTGFVAAFLTPLIGIASGAVGDFSKEAFDVAGVTFPYGAFLQALISFVLVAAVIYFAVVVPVGRLQNRFYRSRTSRWPRPTARVPQHRPGRRDPVRPLHHRTGRPTGLPRPGRRERDRPLSALPHDPRPGRLPRPGRTASRRRSGPPRLNGTLAQPFG